MPRWALLVSLLVSGLASGLVPLSSVEGPSNLPFIPNRFIIELDTAADIPSKRSSNSLLANVLESVQRRAPGINVTKTFESPGLFVGAAITLDNPQSVTAVTNIPGVKAIRPVVRLQQPRPFQSYVVDAKKDRRMLPDTFSPHVMTGVDKLHAKGITGAGVKIGVIDTGVDYNHPLLGGGIGPGHKIVGGYDFVGDDFNGSNTPVPDDDPFDECNGHGTHITGIIGANPGNEYGLSGVAYNASITAYRILGCFGPTTDELVVEALLRGVQEGQDILTLSVGESAGWTEGTASVVASRVAASGKIVTIAAGNDGFSGAWYSSSPSNGIDVISVASVDNTVIPVQSFSVDGVDNSTIAYFHTSRSPLVGTFPVFATSTDTTVMDDACDPLSEDIPDLSTFAVLVRRGTCSFEQKARNIAEKGGRTVLIYDNGSGFAPIDTSGFNATLIPASDGELLARWFATGSSPKITFHPTDEGGDIPNPDGGLVSPFSTYGPTNDFHFKPALAAPGGTILSTYPISLGSFAVISGTSMSTPFVAGSAALLLSVKGRSKDIVTGARSLFQTTASMVPSSKTDGDPLQTLAQQGAGLINVFNAVNAETIVSRGELILNDTANFRPVQTFSVKNQGRSAKTFKLSHVPAGTALTYYPDSIWPIDGPVPLSATAASVVISPSTLVVLPGQTVDVTATFHLPTTLDKTQYPLFSGFIQLTAPGEAYHVSYIGLGASLKEKRILDNTDEFFGISLPSILQSGNTIQVKPRNYTFVGIDTPKLLYRLSFGTPILRLDLVDPNTTFVPTIPLPSTLARRALVGGDVDGDAQSSPFFTFPHTHSSGTFAQVKIIGPLAQFDFVPRHDDNPTRGGTGSTSLILSPTFANGTRVPNGEYRLLVRALKVTGDREREEDYESWLSPVIGVQVP